MGYLATPISVRKLQKALHVKAKTEDNYRFYALYDKLYRQDVLTHAYAKCRANRGAPGVDRQDFSDVETYGVQRWLSELAQALKDESYRPDAIRRVYATVEEEHQEHGAKASWNDDKLLFVHGHHRNGKTIKSHTGWMGELLFSRNSSTSVSCN